MDNVSNMSGATETHLRKINCDAAGEPGIFGLAGLESYTDHWGGGHATGCYTTVWVATFEILGYHYCSKILSQSNGGQRSTLKHFKELEAAS